MGWYTIFVESGYEDEVAYLIRTRNEELIEKSAYQLLIPKRRLIERRQGKNRKVVRKMFPGYILVETDNVLEFYKHICCIPHIRNILHVDGTFLEIKKKEINDILIFGNDNGIIEMSKGVRVGSTVHITEGPLVGYEGKIKKIDWRRCRVKVNFDINDCVFPIYLGLEDEYKII